MKRNSNVSPPEAPRTQSKSAGANFLTVFIIRRTFFGTIACPLSSLPRERGRYTKGDRFILDCGFCRLKSSFENTALRDLRNTPHDFVVPASSAGTQVDMDVSGRIPQTWMPAIHAGMTKSALSLSVGERTLMKHFVAKSLR
jgi:hypothetical protein